MNILHRACNIISRIVFCSVMKKKILTRCSGNKTSLKIWLDTIKLEVVDLGDACAIRIKNY